jgi:rod shape-determining protein MreC
LEDVDLAVAYTVYCFMSRYSRERLWVAIVLALILCAVVTLVSHQYDTSGGSDPLTNATRTVLFAPVLRGSDTVVTWWELHVTAMFRGPTLAAQNRALQAKIADIMQQNRILSDEADENARLRTLLAFKARDSRILLPAEVLALKPFADRDSAVFSRGLDDRVKLKQPALDQNGDLAGQVTDVSSTTCDVLLLTDTLSSVGARVVDPATAIQTPFSSQSVVGKVAFLGLVEQAANAPAPPVATVGICMGDRSNLLQLTDLPSDADVQVGDTVVTSGLGGVYPKDIPIGRIVEVDFDKTRYLKSALVAPFADFNHLQEGFLLQ